MDSELANLIVESLTPEMVKPAFKAWNKQNRLAGHCYHASEAFFHLAGGKAAGLKPCRLDVRIMDETISHWYLKRGREIIDLTADQFRFPLNYGEGKGCGFLTAEPSKAAAEIIRRVRKAQKERK